MPHSRRTTAAAMGVSLVLVTLTTPCEAQVRIVQNSCAPSGSNYVAQFAFVSLPSTGGSVCQINAFPLTAECFPLQCGTPPAWTCFPGDVTTFLRANDDGDACIAPGETLGGFQFGISEPICCLMFNYFASDGTHLGGEEYCFDCTAVGVEPHTWGGAKQLYK